MTIEERAYYIWESNGRLPGTADHDWNQALREDFSDFLLAELRFNLDDPIIDKLVAIKILYPGASSKVIDTLWAACYPTDGQNIDPNDWYEVVKAYNPPRKVEPYVCVDCGTELITVTRLLCRQCRYKDRN